MATATASDWEGHTHVWADVDIKPMQVYECTACGEPATGHALAALQEEETDE